LIPPLAHPVIVPAASLYTALGAPDTTGLGLGLELPPPPQDTNTDAVIKEAQYKSNFSIVFVLFFISWSQFMN
jgi:hypothetical protein